ncbi:Alpha/Beta hydrolase protein [Fennellomyces sp. T-0311]|nr:Alpha/Beta hydrolase protein [Fennellomyces sp. T-0311]
MKILFPLTILTAFMLPLASTFPLAHQRRQTEESAEAEAIETNGPLPKGTKTVFGMALNATDYPETVEAALNGTRIETLAATRDATAAEIEELTFYSALSANVYCPAVAPGGLWVCPNCGLTRHLEIVDTFNTLVTDMNGLIARDDSEKTIIVVFRGSVSLNNWIADLTAVWVTYPSVPLAYVHGGFLGAWEEVSTQVVRTVKSQLSSHPGYKVVITGHSLGGAVAVLSALEFYRDGITNLALYTQGQPRVGNRAFANHIVSTGIQYKRSVHSRDLVPHVPDSLLGYSHAGEEYWEVPLGNRVQVCRNGIETSDCANSIAPFTSFLDHTTYFGMSTGICL